MAGVKKDGGQGLPIVTIVIDHCIMKIETQMSTTNFDPTTLSINTINSDSSNEENPVDPTLIKWEEWSLSAEEHFHALQKFRENPKGRPLGHKV